MLSILALTVPSIEEPPSKRTKVNQAKNRGNVKSILFKRFHGCLSELPTMPLDVLYEIFVHLSPADLLSLGRVSKAFRFVLMSRQSSFLWNASLYNFGAPPCPQDMCPPAWSHLLFGSTNCNSCGAPRVTKILFSLRRRNAKSVNHPSRTLCVKHWWDEDVQAFKDELHAHERADQVPDCVLPNTTATTTEFLEEKKKLVVDNQEGSKLTSILACRQCLAWEKARETERNNVLSDAREKRFNYIKTKFPSPYYLEADVKILRLHREVRTSKPITDRACRTNPPSSVNDARHQRLMREGGEAYHQRWNVLVTHYGDFLKTLPPLHLALGPTAVEFLSESQALADAVAFGSDHESPQLIAQISEAIGRLELEIETEKQKRANLLRSLLPRGNVPEYATDEEALGLATSIYECSDCHLSASGLHMLAHQCDRAQKLKGFSPQLSVLGRAAVEELLQRLGLGRETTALELDRRNDRFICLGCPRASFIQNGVDVLGRCVRDWRSCIAHAIGAKKERWHVDEPIWSLVRTTETVPISGDEYSSYHAFACLHCPIRIDPASGDVQWFRNVSTVKEHVRTVHWRNRPMEGEDFYYNVGTTRSGCRSLLAMAK
ncbi:hypothetical protein BGW80DRAFT_1314332 [Lactifluus volemus]|nr:hypothetical protein BGW80DRAFT_1314332 [Lactifluus volemus]